MHPQRIFVAVLVCLVVVAFPARSSGPASIVYTGGPTMDGDLVLSASYMHPLPVNQIYLTGGLGYIAMDYQVAAVAPEAYVGIPREPPSFHGITQLNIGVRLGDHLFASPKLSYNWYGKHHSPGWGIAAGFLLHPLRPFSFGFCAAYDQIDMDHRESRQWVPGITTVFAVFQVALEE